MDLDLHVSRFDWAASPAAIGPGVLDLARRAEAIGGPGIAVAESLEAPCCMAICAENTHFQPGASDD